MSKQAQVRNWGGNKGIAMKIRFLMALAGMMLTPGAWAQEAFYINDQVISVPPQPYAPQIDATNFVNENLFLLDLYDTNSLFFTGYSFFGSPAYPYKTSNTLNYTNSNTGTLSSFEGFDFQTWPYSGGPRMASSFFNDSLGTINVATNGGSYYLPLQGFSGYYYGAAAQLVISATNVFNRGSINMGPDTLLRITGKRVDLSRSALSMEGFGSTYGSADGIFDGYWGVGTPINGMDPANDLSGPWAFTPDYWVTNRDYSITLQNLFFANYTPYASDFAVGTNRLVQAVFLQNPNPGISNKVYFLGGPTGFEEIVVEWNWLSTNYATGLPETNYLYLTDSFLGMTNRVYINGLANGQLTYQPGNYWFYRSMQPLGFGIPAPPGLPAGLFDAGNLTNEYAAYQAIFQPSSAIPGDIYGQTVPQLPGRVEITGSGTLDLTQTRITANNFISISATNHFMGSGRATIAAPYLSLNLGSTNGVLAVSNTIVPSISRPLGLIDLWSGRWSSATAFSNRWHVLFVDSRIVSAALPSAYDVGLRVRNQTGLGTNADIFVSDVMNIQNSLLIQGQSLTLTTNEPGSPTPYGAINLTTLNLPEWSQVTPLLRNLTNNGALTTPNAAIFATRYFPPYSTSNALVPYLSMVNNGSISNNGTTLMADWFVNSGKVDAGQGSLTLQATSAWLTNGTFMARKGLIRLAAKSMVVSNYSLTSGNALTLTATTLLDDGSLTQPVATVTNKSFWSVGFGFNLSNLPTAGSLLATTITDAAPAQLNVVIPHLWPGVDRGATAQGYSSNCAVGRLVLNSSMNCLFSFAGTGLSNALYVDVLELEGVATNRDKAGNLTSLDLAPNMVIYYAQALMGGVSVAEKLNHRNGDRLRWVSGYAGYFSSTNILYPDGKTYSFNAALAASCNFDSNNNGIANCSDPAPIFVLSQFSALPIGKVLNLGWNVNAGGWATNTVYFTPTLVPVNWQVLTQFVSRLSGGRLGATDAVGKTNRFYRVNVSMQQP
jgi:hypothetical protein